MMKETQSEIRMTNQRRNGSCLNSDTSKYQPTQDGLLEGATYTVAVDKDAMTNKVGFAQIWKN